MAEHPSRDAFRGPFSLTGDFSPPTLEEWRNLATSSLRGKPIGSLTVDIEEGVAVKPLYTAADDSQPPGRPGRPPFTRGSLNPEDRPHGWYSCPLYEHPLPGSATRPIAAESDADVTAAWIKPVGADTLKNGDCASWTVNDMRQLVGGIENGASPILLDGGDNGVAFAALFTAAVRHLGADLDSFSGSFSVDPLASLARTGELAGGADRAFGLMAGLTSWCLHKTPRVRAAAVSTIPYHMAGATTVQEMAFALATGVEYLRAFESAGIEPALGCRQILFRFAIGRDLFTEVARMRAFRRLWAGVAAACGVTDDAAAASIHAVTSPRSLTIRDPWVNMLRTTVGTFAAAIGEADYITTLPFDTAVGPTGDLGLHLAINTQRVLREESHLDHVLDPGGGSWYIERLTDQLSGTAWRSFQDIERNGGMRQALTDGVVASVIDEAARAGRQLIATRRMPITGVSTWPNLAEAAITPADPEAQAVLEGDRATGCSDEHSTLRTLAELAREIAAGPRKGAVFEAAVAAADAGATLGQLSQALHAGSEPLHLAPLPEKRDAEPFERLRDASDEHLQRTGSRPRVFLANLGSVADYTARTTFAKNLLEAGGIETIDTGGFDTAAAAVEAFVASNCTLVCLCSSAERYEELVPDLVPDLRANGARAVILADRPGPETGDVDHHIYRGCDVLRTLDAVLSTLEVAP